MTNHAGSSENPMAGPASPGPIAENQVAETPVTGTPRSPAVTAEDLAVIADQLGRTPRGVVAIAARCRCGRPVVVRTAPRLEDGTPFPTTFYLTSPPAVRAVSTLEASGAMAEMTERLAQDDQLAESYRRAHEDYLRRRGELGEVPELHGVSAGGMPTRVKCLHVLVAHALATGPGVNPLGDEALALIAGRWRIDRCECDVSWGREP